MLIHSQVLSQKLRVSGTVITNCNIAREVEKNSRYGRLNNRILRIPMNGITVRPLTSSFWELLLQFFWQNP